MKLHYSYAGFCQEKTGEVDKSWVMEWGFGAIPRSLMRYSGGDSQNDLKIDFVLNDVPDLCREFRRGFEHIARIIQSMRV